MTIVTLSKVLRLKKIKLHSMFIIKNSTRFSENFIDDRLAQYTKFVDVVSFGLIFL